MVRRLTLCGTKEKPQISLRGKWLKDLGFLPENKIEVFESQGCLLIKVMNNGSVHLHDIAGYEHVKRILEVALVQEHSVTLVGHREVTQPFLNWGIQHKLPIQAFSPCVCGWYMSQKDCSCIPSEIRKHQLVIKVSDINLVIIPERYDLHHALAEREAALLTRVSEAQKIVQEIPEILCTDGGYLLRHASDRFGFDHSRIKRVLRVAQSIASLDYQTEIKVHHLSEAIQYSIKPDF